MKKQDRFGLSDGTADKLKALFRKYPQIEKVLLYGSRAMGTHKPGSDIDLALIAPSLTAADLLKIANEIDDLLLPYKVDLALMHEIGNSDLVNRIERVGQEFVS